MNIHRSQSLIRPMVLGLALAGVPALAVTATASSANASAASSCGISWGSLSKSSASRTSADITNVRSGQHACFDRLVIDLGGSHSRAGYQVKYVTNVYAEGTGKVVPLRGGADLQIIAKAPTHNTAGHSTYTPANPRELTNVAGYRTFRQVAMAGSFEGQTTIGLGVRARLPFRVTTLAGPANGTRLVIDVAHRW